MKPKRLIKVLIILAFCCLLMIAKSNVSLAASLSSNIDGIDESKYPGVKSLIKNLQRNHANYNFQVYYTDIDWTEAITMEYQGHGKSPKNLFSLGNNYKGKWHCPICGSRTYDTGWYCASIDAIKYMMDPRNSLDETSVFQFKNLEASDVTAENIGQVINSKYASYAYINNPTAIGAIVNASTQYQLNGYSILAKIINEQGTGKSPLATGSGYNGQYVGYYNFFNVGAYGNGTATVITNGLKYAQNKGWNSVESSIMGGSEYYKSQYIGRGQNTLYYQRFNVVYTPSLFSHQYQQDIMGAQTSSTLLKNYYTMSSTLSSVNHTFIIPLYENMPAQACARPSTAQNSTLDGEEASVLTDKLAVRAAPCSNRIISYLNKNEKVHVIERASKASSDGKYWDIIVSNTDGTYGYVPRSEISKKNNYPVYVFDYQYYADNNSDLKEKYGYNESKLYDHFVTEGMKEGRSSSAVFNVKYYLENNSDLAMTFGNDYSAACNHFMNYGYLEYRKSSPEYDNTFYKYYYQDLTALTPLQLMKHYMNYGRAEGRLGGLEASVENGVFDAIVYAECNSDLKAAFGNNEQLLKRHWITYGIREGRISSLAYSAEMYALINSDVQQVFGNDPLALFMHFIKDGIVEGRASSLLFDPVRYLTLNTDVKAVFGNNYKQAYSHFELYGINEARVAGYVFEIPAYLSANSDIKAAFGNQYKLACIHFLNHGINERRRSSSMFDVTYYRTHNQDLQNEFGNNIRQYYLHYLKYGIKENRKAIE